MRRVAWAKYRQVHGWSEKDLVSSYALKAIFASMLAAVLFLDYLGTRGAPLGLVFLSLSGLAVLASVLFFLLDLQAPRQSVKGEGRVQASRVQSHREDRQAADPKDEATAA